MTNMACKPNVITVSVTTDYAVIFKQTGNELFIYPLTLVYLHVKTAYARIWDSCDRNRYCSFSTSSQIRA